LRALYVDRADDDSLAPSCRKAPLPGKIKIKGLRVEFPKEIAEPEARLQVHGIAGDQACFWCGQGQDWGLVLELDPDQKRHRT